MLKTFKLYVEERDQDRQLKDALLTRLGFNPKAMEDSTIKIRDLSKDRLKQAVSSIGFDDDTVQQLTNWIENNPDTTLQNLLAQIDGKTVDDSDQDDIPEAPAKLPAGQPQPERQPAPSMYGGGPPTSGQMT